MQGNSTSQPHLWEELVEKFCPGCKKHKLLKEFGKYKNVAYGKCSYCKECKKKKCEKYRKENLEKHRRSSRIGQKKYRQKRRDDGTAKAHERKYHIRSYGLTVEQFSAMLENQNHVCAICKRKIEDVSKREKNLAIDHCHKTQKVRGLLCPDCNRALGMFQDNPAILREAIAYLEKHL